MKEKKYVQAIEKYTQAIQLSPGEVVYYSNRAQAYLSNGQYQGMVRRKSAATDSD